MTPKEHIGKIVENLIHILGFDVELTFRETMDAQTDTHDLVCVIKTKEHSQFLIGHHGNNLVALEHLARSIARQQGIAQRFRIDINDYREGKKQMFLRIARDAAHEASRNKKPVLLRPMNAYERRIIHTAIAEDERVTTESIDAGSERKVVIKPVSIIE